MREMLFRGKRYDGVWMEGGLFMHDPVRVCFSNEKNPAEPMIITDGFCDWGFEPPMMAAKVIPETVGQFTGLTDKNGKKIFEGDIFNLEDEIMAVVIFKDGCFRLEEYGLRGTWTESGFDECGGSWGVIDCDPIDWYSLYAAEIIGNIHDNPELLGDMNATFSVADDNIKLF